MSWKIKVGQDRLGLEREVEADIQSFEAKVKGAERVEKAAIAAADNARFELASALRMAADQGFKIARFDQEMARRDSSTNTETK